MNDLTTHAMHGKQTIERAKLERYGELDKADVQNIADDPETRLELILVRCGGGRFMAPANQVLHFVEIIERDARAQEYLDRKGPEGPKAGPPSDYIRDISLPVKENGHANR